VRGKVQGQGLEHLSEELEKWILKVYCYPEVRRSDRTQGDRRGWLRRESDVTVEVVVEDCCATPEDRWEVEDAGGMDGGQVPVGSPDRQEGRSNLEVEAHTAGILDQGQTLREAGHSLYQIDREDSNQGRVEDADTLGEKMDRRVDGPGEGLLVVRRSELLHKVSEANNARYALMYRIR
jgi:hypothetical protein